MNILAGNIFSLLRISDDLPPLFFQSLVAGEPPPFLAPDSEEDLDVFFIASSPGRGDSSAAGSDLPASYDLFGSRQPLTQDLEPEVLLQEPEVSSPAASSSHVSIFSWLTFCSC